MSIASQLSSQLRSMQKAHAVRSSSGKLRVSFLFEAEKAADMDAETVFNIGVSGFEDLVQKDARLADFRKALFSPHGLKDREAITEGENKKINKQIGAFLRLLSPYFLLPAAHQVLEHLIRRYQVHRFNKNELLTCVFPFHETPLFARVLMLLDIEKDEQWKWLITARNNRSPLSKHSLIGRCLRASDTLEWVCQHAKRACADKLSGTAQWKNATSFYASTVVGVLKQSTVVDEAVVRVLLPFVVRGLKSDKLPYRTASLMVLCQLCASTTLSGDVIAAMLPRMVAHLSSAVEVDKAVSCLVVLFQTQSVSAAATTDVIQRLLACERHLLIGAIGDAANKFDTSAFLARLCDALSSLTLSLDDTDTADCLVQVVSEIALPTEVAQSLIKATLGAVADGSFDRTTSDCSSQVDTLVATLQRKYKAEFDTVMESVVEEVGSNTALQSLSSQLLSSTTSQVVGDTNQSLFFALESVDAHVRKEALDKFCALAESGSLTSEEIASTFERRLAEDDPTVLNVLFSCQVLMDYVSHDAVSSRLERLLRSFTIGAFPVNSDAHLTLLYTATGLVATHFTGQFVGNGSCPPTSQKCNHITTSSAPAFVSMLLRMCWANTSSSIPSATAAKIAWEVLERVGDSPSPLLRSISRKDGESVDELTPASVNRHTTEKLVALLEGGNEIIASTMMQCLDHETRAADFEAHEVVPDWLLLNASLSYLETEPEEASAKDTSTRSFLVNAAFVSIGQVWTHLCDHGDLSQEDLAEAASRGSSLVSEMDDNDSGSSFESASGSPAVDTNTCAAWVFAYLSRTVSCVAEGNEHFSESGKGADLSLCLHHMLSFFLAAEPTAAFRPLTSQTLRIIHASTNVFEFLLPYCSSPSTSLPVHTALTSSTVVVSHLVAADNADAVATVTSRAFQLLHAMLQSFIQSADGKDEVDALLTDVCIACMSGLSHPSSAVRQSASALLGPAASFSSSSSSGVGALFAFLGEHKLEVQSDPTYTARALNSCSSQAVLDMIPVCVKAAFNAVSKPPIRSHLPNVVLRCFSSFPLEGELRSTYLSAASHLLDLYIGSVNNFPCVQFDCNGCAHCVTTYPQLIDVQLLVFVLQRVFSASLSDEGHFALLLRAVYCPPIPLYDLTATSHKLTHHRSVHFSVVECLSQTRFDSLSVEQQRHLVMSLFDITSVHGDIDSGLISGHGAPVRDLLCSLTFSPEIISEALAAPLSLPTFRPAATTSSSSTKITGRFTHDVAHDIVKGGNQKQFGDGEATPLRVYSILQDLVLRKLIRGPFPGMYSLIGPMFSLFRTLNEEIRASSLSRDLELVRSTCLASLHKLLSFAIATGNVTVSAAAVKGKRKSSKGKKGRGAKKSNEMETETEEEAVTVTKSDLLLDEVYALLCDTEVDAASETSEAAEELRFLYLQSQSYALSLLSTLATLIPEDVAPVIVDLFRAYVEQVSSLLVDGDNAALATVEKAVRTILPSLVAASETQVNLAGLLDVLLSCAPKMTRSALSRLLISFVESVGDQHLGGTLSVLLVRNVAQSEAAKTSSSNGMLIEGGVEEDEEEEEEEEKKGSHKNKKKKTKGPAFRMRQKMGMHLNVARKQVEEMDWIQLAHDVAHAFSARSVLSALTDLQSLADINRSMCPKTAAMLSAKKGSERRVAVTSECVSLVENFHVENPFEGKSTRVARKLIRTVLKFVTSHLSTESFMDSAIAASSGSSRMDVESDDEGEEEEGEEEKEEEEGLESEYLSFFTAVLLRLRCTTELQYDIQVVRTEQKREGMVMGADEEEEEEEEEEETSSKRKRGKKVTTNNKKKGRSEKRFDANKKASVSFVKALATISGLIYDSIERLLTLLSIPSFVYVVRMLLSGDDPQIRKKAMQLLNEHVEVDSEEEDMSRFEPYLELLPLLEEVVQGVETEHTENRQMALYTIDSLAGAFAGLFPSAFVSVLPTVLQSLHDAHAQVIAAGLLCVSTFCAELNTKMLHALPKFFPRTLELLSASLDEEKRGEEAGEHGGDDEEEEEDEERSHQHTLQLSALSTIEVAVSTMPRFLNPYLPAVLRAIMHPSIQDVVTKVKETDSSDDAALAPLTGTVTRKEKDRDALSAAVDSIFGLVSTELEPRVTLPHLQTIYADCLTMGASSLVAIFRLLGLIAGSLTKKNVKEQYPVVFKFIMQGLRLRQHHSGSVLDSDLFRVEESVCDAFCQLVMKLSEKQLKGVFTKMVQWLGILHLGDLAGTSDGSTTTSAATTSTSEVNKHVVKVESEELHRAIPFFRVAGRLATQLQSLFVPLSGYFLDHCVRFLSAVDLLNDNESDENGRTTSSRPKKRVKQHRRQDTQQDEGSGQRQDELCELHELVLDTLTLCFKADDETFYRKESFDQLRVPLVRQLVIGCMLRTDEESYLSFISHHLLPCITECASLMGNFTLWKPLNHDLLMTTRSSQAVVRRAALMVVESMFVHNRENWLVLLPETMPFISELMEDEDVEVEALCQQVIKHIETLSGESLDQYLQ